MTRRKVLLAVLLSFVLGGVCGWFLPRLAPKPPSEPPPKPSSEPAPIDSGFFFSCGVYVSPPYHVTLDDDGVKINGIKVEGRPWVPGKGRPIPDTDPGPFKWTPERLKQGMSKSGFMRHTGDRFWNWCKEDGFDEACRRFEVYLKEQPLVTKVECEVTPHGVSFLYWTKDGQMRGKSFARPRTKAQREENRRLTEESLRQAVVSLRQTLASGRALLRGGGTSNMSRGWVVRHLPRVYDIAKSGEPKEAKTTALLTEKLFPDRESAEAFVAGFQMSRSLEKRIDELREQAKQHEEAKRYQLGPETK